MIDAFSLGAAANAGPALAAAPIGEVARLVLAPENVLLIVIASVIGVIMGATPGIGPSLTLAIALPFTFAMEPATGLMVMAVLYGSVVYGGSITAILVRIPGDATSTATLLDGYPMTENGEGLTALSASTTASFIGAVLGLTALALFAPPLARFSLVFGAPEMFMLAVLGLAVVAAVTPGSLFKSMVAASLGVFFASIGADPITGVDRFTFGTFYLQAGMNIVVVAVGLFAISQVIDLWLQSSPIAKSGKIEGSLFEGVRNAFSRVSVLGSAIGITIGAVPGAGAMVANFFSYLAQMRLSGEPEAYGSGKVEGVVAAESSNNAGSMASLIPAMALSIPGSVSSALFIAAMTTHGITPGPSVFADPYLPTVVFSSIFIGDLVFLVVGLFGASYLVRVTTLHRGILVAIIVILSLTGAFLVRNAILDVFAAILFGILGYAMMRNGYSLIAFIMAFILVPIAERGFLRALLISGGDYSIFFTRPVSLALFVVSVVVLLLPALVRRGNVKRETSTS